MFLGVLQVHLLIHESNSLKAKRKVLKSIMGKVGNKFNVSIAEVGDNDKWSRAQIGLAFVGNNHSFINSSMDKAINYIESMALAEITDHYMEIINFSEED